MFTSILLRVNKFFAMNSFVKNRTITLPENTSITPEMVEKLDDLLSTSQPNGIRKNILKIYMQYLINEHDTLPNDFQDIAYDFYHVIEFFTAVETEYCKMRMIDEKTY